MKCDVHYYTEGDESDKEVFFCPDCNAWICKDCKHKYVKRIIASFNRFLINLLSWKN